jgi:hypothetical protein
MNNAVRDVLFVGGPATAPGSPAAAIAGSSTGGAAAPVGPGTSVARVQISIALGFLVAVGVLVMLNRAGFKFSVTVGG